MAARLARIFRSPLAVRFAAAYLVVLLPTLVIKYTFLSGIYMKIGITWIRDNPLDETKIRGLRRDVSRGRPVSIVYASSTIGSKASKAKGEPPVLLISDVP